jgi:hypothetical protein
MIYAIDATKILGFVTVLLCILNAPKVMKKQGFGVRIIDRLINLN